MFLEKLKHVTTFIFDVDGVLTNGDILASDSGEFLRTFNIKDGYALQLAVKRGFLVVVISGGKGLAMQKRFEGLNIPEVFLGVSDKVSVFNQLVTKYELHPDQILYMGDDIPDLKVMQLVGLPVCPADAVPEIKAVSQYISPYTGGKTAVRDIIEKTLKVQQKWFDEQPDAADSSK
ncbi:KdsC family phosphatase [Pedobacter metabolipauper]|uniref:3-deoxy-D-manno-octulosonate 8-phosphate phosphatase (KDO 8-P phosphatase) n=1 Tax=Pedobacter metabolipauper TaxID=425513 RepID=A0A4R6SU38_9SPHI|nr:HAD-IIIA family hydrolase [Pedobacter metabolipauper]TDQ08528.1 3-deoxy-D-manno-octulosonate 8-phosphate phosphatase (KDO 8-P phosphatase) [Pedobacter metabolipauper]